MNTLFLIPARGGSKGVPGKNLRKLGGVPLVGRAVRTAVLAAATLAGKSRIVCSTEDPAIADAARAYGGEVPFLRPAQLARDETPSMDVVIHALDGMTENFDSVVLLQCTSPLVEASDVAGALSLHQTTGAPVVSVCLVDHPIEWTYRIGAAGQLMPSCAGHRPSRRQDIPPTYRLNGAIWVASPQWLRREKSFIGPETQGFVMEPGRSVDIDSELDLLIAETILAQRPR